MLIHRCAVLLVVHPRVRVQIVKVGVDVALRLLRVLLVPLCERGRESVRERERERQRGTPRPPAIRRTRYPASVAVAVSLSLCLVSLAGCFSRKHAQEKLKNDYFAEM